MKQVKAGTILLFTSGTYDDFGIEGLYIAREDFEYTTVPRTPISISKRRFNELHTQGIILELEHKEIWVDT